MPEYDDPDVPAGLANKDAPDWNEQADKNGELIDAATPGDDDDEKKKKKRKKEEEEPFDFRADFLDWMTAHFAVVEVGGNRDGVTWCPQWWKHPEAVTRLWALYQAHKEATQLSDSIAALSDWWLNHWDRHRMILLDAQLGPFRDCSRGHLEGRRKPDELLVSVRLPPDEWSPPDA